MLEIQTHIRRIARILHFYPKTVTLITADTGKRKKVVNNNAKPNKNKAGRIKRLSETSKDWRRKTDVEFTHLFVHFNVKAVRHLIILKHKKIKEI